MITRFVDLVTLLDQQHVPHQTAPERAIVTIPTRLHGSDGVQLLRWRQSDSVLDFIQSMDVAVPAVRAADVESAVVAINRALPMPGIDFARASLRLSYRLVLSLAPRGGVEEKEVEAYFRAGVRLGTVLAPTLRAVVAAELAPAGAPAHALAALTADGAPHEPPTAPAPAPSLDELLRLFQID